MSQARSLLPSSERLLEWGAQSAGGRLESPREAEASLCLTVAVTLEPWAEPEQGRQAGHQLRTPGQYLSMSPW